MTNNDPRPELIETARYFYQQGWMMGTAGNLSAKLADGSFWVTASGCAKGRLTTQDFVRVQSQQGVLVTVEGSENRRASAETSIHAAIYDLFPQSQACFHVHSIPANLAGQKAQEGFLPLPPLEMLKGFGLWIENPQVTMPVFKNHLEVPLIATEITQYFQHQPPVIPALLIENHGVTVWGDSLMATFHHLEIAEYLFAYIVASK